MLSQPLRAVDSNVYYRVLPLTDMHGMEMTDSNSSKQVGTFAFGNSYYFFGGASKLFKTIFTPTPIITKFDSTTVDDTYPKTVSLDPGDYVFELAGGKGEDAIGPTSIGSMVGPGGLGGKD